MRRNMLVRIASLTVVVTLLFTQSALKGSAAQSEELVTPKVIDVGPPPGAELLPSDSLTLYFDQPMQPDSPHRTMRFEPDLDGTFTWDDAQTLTFKPKTPWQVGKTYNVIVDGAAKTGARFEAPYTFTVRTLSPLMASNVSPAPDSTDVQAAAQIVVSFNHPMVALGADGTTPFAVTPAVEGKGEWVNTSLYVFKPAKPLASDTAYTVTMAPDLVSSDGATMPERYTWKFHTLPPQVLQVSYRSTEKEINYRDTAPDPQQVYPDTSFVIKFSEPVIRDSVEKLITLREVESGRNYTGTLIGDSDSIELTFDPLESLPRGKNFELVIAPKATSASFTFPFRTIPPPSLVSTFPENGDEQIVRSDNYHFASAEFNVPISEASLTDHVVVNSNPAPSSVSARVTQYSKNVVEIGFPQVAGTTYTVTLKAGIKDIFGLATTRDYTFSFKAIQPPPSPPPPVEPVVNGDLMIFGAYRGNVQIPVKVPSSQTVDFGLYRWDPTITGDVGFSNHQIASPYASYYSGGYSGYGGGTHCKLHPVVKDTNLIRKWSQYFDQDDKDINRAIYPAGPTETLPLGLYWMTMGEDIQCLTNPRADRSVDFVYETGPQYQFGLAVVSANITLKRGPESVFAFVTDLQTANPIPNATVTVYGDGKALGSARTDSTGAATIPVHMQDHRFVLITAEGPKVFAAWYNNWYASGWRTWGGLPEEFDGYDLYDPVDGGGYVYTDRPIYRPGDTVYYRGTLRKKRDLQYPIPQQRKAYIKIGNDLYSVWDSYISIPEGDKYLYQGEVELDDYGSFSGDFVIPPDATLGQIGIWVSTNDRKYSTVAAGNYGNPYVDASSDALVNFTVAEYRAPEIELSIKTPSNNVIQGDPLEAQAQVRYYSGGAVPEANVHWTASGCPTHFNYTGSGSYSFSLGDGYRYLYGSSYDFHNYFEYDYEDYYCKYYYGVDNIDKGVEQTDKTGKATITSETKVTDPPQSGPLTITFEGTVNDDTGNQVSNRVSLIAHPADLYVGISTRSYVAALNKPMSIDLITVTPDSKIEPYQQIKFTAFRYNWQTSSNDPWDAVDKAPVDVKTDGSGKAIVTYTPTAAGSYRIVATVKDSKGRENSAALNFWVTESSSASWYTRRSNDNSLRITTDRPDYRVGDTASLLIPVPDARPATVLVSVERAGVITHYVLTSHGEPLLFQLKITDEMAPNAYIDATFIYGAIPDAATGKRSRPAFRVSFHTRILVASDSRKLNIALKASQGQLKPGETVKFDVTITDSKGKPVVAQVGLKLVDKAVLDLMPDEAGPIALAFFSPQPLETYSDVSIDGLLEDVDLVVGGPPGRGGGGGGGGGGAGPAVRSNFKVTPLWEPDVVTDAQGHASISVTLPDNLTTFRLDARAWTSDANMKVGEAVTDIFSSLPLIVRPQTPRFFVAGDKADLVAEVNNFTDQDQLVRVSVKADGIQLESPAEQEVSLLSNSKARVVWHGTVLNAPGADLTFTAIGQNGAQDATKPTLTTGPNNTIPILSFDTTEMLGATTGMLRTAGSKVEGVAIPPRLKSTEGDLVVTIDSSLASTLVHSFTYLQQYPYYCIEQTTSRFLPNVMTYKALRQLYQNIPQLEANLKTQMAAALSKLANEQRPNGGWGWYPTSQIDPQTSAYATLGLTEARKAGFSVDSAMTDKAVSFVKAQLAAPIGLSDWQLNRQAFYLYVLERAGQPQQADLEALYAIRQRLSYSARAYLLLAFAERLPQHPAVKTITNDLLSAAQYSSTGVSWKEASTDWYNWGTDTRTTALVLAALLRTAPQNDILPLVVRWLMAARQGDHWPTTQETVWSVTALSEWMIATGELRSDYRYDVRFNGNTVSSATVKPSNVEAVTLKFPVGDVKAGSRLAISRGDGPGALYYAAQFNAHVNARDVKAVSRGIAVVRQYFKSDQLEKPVTQATVGNEITVRLTFTVAEDVQYFILEDTYPAGAEAIDTSLLTTSKTTSDTSFSRYDARWYWGWWYLDHTELRDSAAMLTATYLPAGTYVFTYQLRAVTPGVFQAIPTRAYTFYSSDLFGRTDGSLFTITEATRP